MVGHWTILFRLYITGNRPATTKVKAGTFPEVEVGEEETGGAYLTNLVRFLSM